MENDKSTKKIEELLPTGKQNAIHAETLRQMTGLPNLRALRKAVAEEREQGSVILSSSDGYFLPETESELAGYVSLMRSRALSSFKALRSAKMALKKSQGQMPGQLSIFDEG